VISPLLSNIYLIELDAMLERAKAVTASGRHTYVEYARYADDLLILVHNDRRQGGGGKPTTPRGVGETRRAAKRGEKSDRGSESGEELRVLGF
jgi:hypothetical protein